MKRGVLFTLVFFPVSLWSYVLYGPEWNNFPVLYYMNSTGGPNGTSEAVQGAAQSWSQVSGTTIRLTHAGTTNKRGFELGDGINTISWDDLVAMDVGATQNTLGLTFLWYGGSTILASDMVFNTNIHSTLVWVTDLQPSPGDGRFPVDVQSVGLHELGHLLGLNHSADTTAVMYASYTRGRRDLSADDLAAVRFLYPSGQTNAVPRAPSHLRQK